MAWLKGKESGAHHDVVGTVAEGRKGHLLGREDEDESAAGEAQRGKGLGRGTRREDARWGANVARDGRRDLVLLAGKEEEWQRTV